jgi:hypothetical protein
MVLSLLATMPAVSAVPIDAGGNSISSPVASSLAGRVVDAVLGRRGATSPLPECAADSSLSAGQRVLFNDAVVEGARAPVFVPGIGPNCRVSFVGAPGGGAIRVASTVSFNDAWAPSFASAGTADFKSLSGKIVRVPQISVKAMLSVSKYRGFRVFALPFHDRRYAVILLTGSGLDAATARAYTSGSEFKRRSGFVTATVDLAMPKLDLKAASSGCDSPCSNVRLSRTANIVFDEYGSGDGSRLPPWTSKMNLIPLTYPATKVGPNETVRVDQPYYVALVDIDSQSVLLDAFVAHP